MFLSVVLLAQVLVTLTVAVPHTKRAVAFFDPNAKGGSMLDDANGGTGGSDLGEPLNAIGFSTECLGIHLGGPQSANLGDGNGFVNQTVELRQDYGDPNLGTCLESLIGGNHLRVFRQNGPQADSGALFLAVSQEEDESEGHTISPNGYNIGRNSLAANAIGTTSFGGVTYSTIGQNMTGLLPAGATGVNHDIATDGITTLLTVTIT
ncbi:hypothetical protein FB451DRAFT_218913 [Mycena latifolia]|nr:hypothetical protein FB451DRAFT_218913 [Mycena latifolia]